MNKIMNVNERIKIVIKAGIKAKTIADKAGVSYYRIASVINPESYKGESKFDIYETQRINIAIDSILEIMNSASI